MTNRQKSINKMFELSKRLDKIIEEMEIRKESILQEMSRKAA